LLDLVERVGLKAVRLPMDARGRLPIGRVDEAEDLAVALIDPVALVVHAVLALDPDVGFVCRGDIGGFHPGDVVNVHVRRHSGLLARIWSTAWWSLHCGAGRGSARSGPMVDASGAPAGSARGLR